MADWSLAKRWLESGAVIRNSMMREKVFLKLIGSKMTMFEDKTILEVSYSLSWTELKRDDWEIYQEKPKEYSVFICHKCKNQVSEDTMGKECKYCGEWLYNHLSIKKCVLSEKSD